MVVEAVTGRPSIDVPEAFLTAHVEQFALLEKDVKDAQCRLTALPGVLFPWTAGKQSDSQSDSQSEHRPY